MDFTPKWGSNPNPELWALSLSHTPMQPSFASLLSRDNKVLCSKTLRQREIRSVIKVFLYASLGPGAEWVPEEEWGDGERGGEGLVKTSLMLTKLTMISRPSGNSDEIPVARSGHQTSFTGDLLYVVD